MKKSYFIAAIFFSQSLLAQTEDSLNNARIAQMIQLSEVVVRNKLNVEGFIQQVKNDTTFYKAFKNLRILGFSSLNDIRMLDKKNKVKASLSSRTKQKIAGGCRTMETISETATGDFYEGDGSYNYYTAELYASLFFTKNKVCGETNIVSGVHRNVKSKKGLEKNKEQLRMLFFDPGKKIPGIPFMGDKTAIFEPDNAEKYDFSIDYVDFNGQNCYQFTINAKKGKGVVIDRMVTWFNSTSMNIVARNYDISYNAGVYDFDVKMEVVMTQFGNLTVPATLRYNGTWDVAFKKRERGMFTATLFDFTGK
jgi:hypothetical protein